MLWTLPRKGTSTTMAKIIFEQTEYSKYASQGSSPSGQAGYNIWIQYPDDDLVAFLGFCTQEEAAERIKYYVESGKGEDDVVITREKV